MDNHSEESRNINSLSFQIHYL